MHNWIGYTPAMRIKSNVAGNTGTLDFERLWMKVDDNTGVHLDDYNVPCLTNQMGGGL